MKKIEAIEGGKAEARGGDARETRRLNFSPTALGSIKADRNDLPFSVQPASLFRMSLLVPFPRTAPQARAREKKLVLYRIF